MTYSVFNSNLLLICGYYLAINKAILIFRIPTIRNITFILMENLLTLFLLLIIMFMELRCAFVEEWKYSLTSVS